MDRIFPIIIIILFIAATVMCFYENNWRLGLFYLFSAAINVIVII